MDVQQEKTFELADNTKKVMGDMGTLILSEQIEFKKEKSIKAKEEIEK